MPCSHMHLNVCRELGAYHTSITCTTLFATFVTYSLAYTNSYLRLSVKKSFFKTDILVTNWLELIVGGMIILFQKMSPTFLAKLIIVCVPLSLMKLLLQCETLPDSYKVSDMYTLANSCGHP